MCIPTKNTKPIQKYYKWKGKNLNLAFEDKTKHVLWHHKWPSALTPAKNYNQLWVSFSRQILCFQIEFLRSTQVTVKEFSKKKKEKKVSKPKLFKTNSNKLKMKSGENAKNKKEGKELSVFYGFIIQYAVQRKPYQKLATQTKF